jgi:flagellar hook-length control protein FliK
MLDTLSGSIAGTTDAGLSGDAKANALDPSQWTQASAQFNQALHQANDKFQKPADKKPSDNTKEGAKEAAPRAAQNAKKSHGTRKPSAETKPRAKDASGNDDDAPDKTSENTRAAMEMFGFLVASVSNDPVPQAVEKTIDPLQETSEAVDPEALTTSPVLEMMTDTKPSTLPTEVPTEAKAAPMPAMAQSVSIQGTNANLPKEALPEGAKASAIPLTEEFEAVAEPMFMELAEAETLPNPVVSSLAAQSAETDPQSDTMLNKALQDPNLETAAVKTESPMPQPDTSSGGSSSEQHPQQGEAGFKLPESFQDVQVTVQGGEAFQVQQPPVNAANAAQTMPPPTETVRVPGNTVAEQAMNGLNMSMQAGKKEITLQLNPENLGQLRVNLSSNSSQQVTARFIANNVDAQQELQSQIENLKQALEKQGIQVGQITVTMNNAEAGNARNAQQEQQNFFQQQQQQDTFQHTNQQSGNQHYQQATQNQTDGLTLGDELLMDPLQGAAEEGAQTQPNNPNGRISVLI